MTTVVWYDSTETGAPTLNNAAGSLDALLNACLVTGFRTQTLTSVTVSGGVATATLAGHGYSDKRVLELAGAGTAAINGRKLITVSGSGTFTFPAPGVPDGTISGTITAKRAPLGWARPLSSGNVSIYTRTDPTATAMALRVDDSGSGVASATAARWRMVEGFTDLNTFTGPAPGASVYGGGGMFVPKGANSTTAKSWVLVGDGKTFYMFTESSNYSASSYSGVPQGIWMFGDISPFKAGDAYCCAIAGASSDTGVDGQGMGYAASLSSTPSSAQFMVARSFSGLGGPVNMLMVGSNSRIGGVGPVFPSPVDNGMVINVAPLVVENSAAFTHPVRGALRGLGAPQAAIPGGLLHLQVLENLNGSDRRWLMVGFNQQGSYGHAAFDITGPW